MDVGTANLWKKNFQYLCGGPSQNWKYPIKAKKRESNISRGGRGAMVTKLESRILFDLISNVLNYRKKMVSLLWLLLAECMFLSLLIQCIKGKKNQPDYFKSSDWM